MTFRALWLGPLVALGVLGFGCGETIEKETIREVMVEVPTTIIKEVPVYPDAGAPVVIDCTKQVYSEQPTIAAHSSVSGKNVITVDGKQFKDLSGDGALDPYEDWRLLEICRARDLVSKMTVPQKVGLMSESSSIGSGTTDGSISDTTRGRIVDQFVRQALIRFSDNVTPQNLAVYLNAIQELCETQPLGIPFVVTADPVHGIGFNTDRTTGANTLSSTKNVSHWPYPLGLGAINDAEVTRQYGDAVRQEFMAMGFRWQLGPMADISTEPRWARVQNVFGENAIHVAKHVKATVEGFQGSATGDLRDGIAATVKHFPGAGANQDGMDSHTWPGRFNVYPADNFEYHLIPFQAGFDSGAAALMACYSIFQGQHQWDPYQVASGFSHGLMTRLAKERMGFTGMITGDWGTGTSRSWGLESLTNAEKAALWVKAGSHQYGSDSASNFQDAFDQGLLTEKEIDGAAEKILEMSFELGIFENPYVNPDLTPQIVKSAELRTAGFVAQQRAIVLLHNPPAADRDGPENRILPIAGVRARPDADGDGTIRVWFDGITDSLAGTDQMEDVLGDYDYAAPGGEGVRPIVQAAGLADPELDVAVIRISARKGTYFGLDNGVPLSFDAPFPGASSDGNLASAIKDRNKVIDAFRIRDGYTNASGDFVEPTNPTLRIVLVMHMDRPGIVKPFVNGLKTLDELPDQPGSYPRVSDEANVQPTVVKGVDALLVEFGAYDRAVLDFVFNLNAPAVGHGRARLPMEIPSSDAEVDAQLEDLPGDTRAPTFRIGAGTTLGMNLPQ